VGFTPEGSDGQDNSGLEGEFVTTIWSVSCNGTLSAGVIGGKKILFKVNATSNAIIAVPVWPATSAKLKRSGLSEDSFELEAVPFTGK